MDAVKPVVRKSIPLTADDVAALDALRASAMHRVALAERSGLSIAADDSEASLLHSLVVAGLRAVNEEVEAIGYLEMAAERSRSKRKASARRRTPDWADE